MLEGSAGAATLVLVTLVLITILIITFLDTPLISAASSIRTRMRGANFASRSPNQLEHDGAKFVFFMGLEGTGHHMMASLVESSPIKKNIHRLKLEADLYTLQMSLYDNDKKSAGLWSLPCEPNGEYGHSRPMDVVTDLLQRMKTRASSNFSTTSNDIAIPINCIGLASRPPTNMLSYPNYLGTCRPLQYPNVELLDQSCAAANVTCAYVYLYRDPHAILHSTAVRRHYHATMSSAIKLYTGLYHILESQLRNVASSLLLCHDYDDEPSWELGRLLGWENKTAFGIMLKEVWMRSPPMTQTEKEEMVPWELQPYMKSMLHAHGQTKDTCLALTGHSTR